MSPVGSSSEFPFQCLHLRRQADQDVILNLMPQLKPEIVLAAIEGFESQKRRIDDQIAELRSMLPGATPEGTTESARPKRKVSAAARRRMALGQQRRWAAIKDGAGSGASEPSKPRRKLSAAGRAAIVAALKKRRAVKKAAAKKAAAKKVSPESVQ
jgi:hypothetical protein